MIADKMAREDIRSRTSFSNMEGVSYAMIEVSNLTKLYGTKRAVNDISFTINEGEVVGFLGPNGAGKSTTMNMICGIVRPTLGKTMFMGEDFGKNRKRLINNLGYIPLSLFFNSLEHFIVSIVRPQPKK